MVAAPLQLMQTKRAIVVIGCSQGGVEALTGLLAGFVAAWPATIFITSHIGGRPTELPQLLGRTSAMPVSHARDFEAFEPGHVYMAPPDHHLYIGRVLMRLSAGPRVNWTRPAIDPMFRSAAEVHGPAVIALLLTGNQADGVNGLEEVQIQGGQTIVQDPAEAVACGMPANALARIVPDHVLRLVEIPEILSLCISNILMGDIKERVV